MALRVARSPNLIGNEEFFAEMNKKLPENTGAVDYNKSLTEATIKLIQDNISISLPRNSRVVSISFESPSSELAARIANAKASDDQAPSEKGGKQPPYEEWTRDALYERAQELGIEGRADMKKDELITALREH